MDDKNDYPSQYPMGRFRDEDVGHTTRLPRSATNAPWIDIHGHHHTLTWRDHSEFSRSGCAAVVMTGGLGYETPYRPVRAADVRSGWDLVLWHSHSMARSHFFDVHVAVGVHTSPGPIAGVDELLDVLPTYAALDEVVAISETGISMVQEHESLPLDEQKRLIADQMAIAHESDLPMVLHTPSVTKGSTSFRGVSTEAHDHGELVLERDTAKRDAAEICLELAAEVGLPERHLVFTHAHPPMSTEVLEKSDAYLSFTVGDATRPTTAADVAAAIERHGSERIMIDSDCAGNKQQTPVAIKEAMLALHRLSVDPAAVDTVAYENQIEVLNLDVAV
ncbi:MAG: TatD family hydrolase [Halodesulfurarchaeum sp.]